MDTGLAAYLCRWPTSETIENGAMDGAFLETYVVTEIVKSYFNAGKATDIYYLKKSKEPAKPDKNFDVLHQFKMDVAPGIILCIRYRKRKKVISCFN